MASTHLPTKPVAVVDRDDDELAVEDDLESSPVPAYRYEPLPTESSFRLLELRPGEAENPLEVNIGTHDIAAPTLPSYYAVSYTWGASVYDRLVIAGRSIPPDDPLHSRYSIRHSLWSDGRRLLISTNLRNLLQRFRHHRNPVTLWIDAICINQDDINERASQVLLMKTIYYNAHCVWLWLGEELEGSSSAVKILSHVGRISESVDLEGPQVDKRGLPEMIFSLAENPSLMRRLGESVHGPQVDKLGLPEMIFSHAENPPHLRRLSESVTLHEPLLDELGIPQLDSSDWKSVVKLFDRPVFRRIWIIQEVVTARETFVFCGPGAPVNLTDIFQAVIFLISTGIGKVINNRFASGENYMQDLLAWCRYQVQWALYTPGLRWSLISETRRCQASDPRDKIFAIIGLFRDMSRNINLDLSAMASELDVKTDIDIPGRSIDKAAICSLWTSTNPKMRELHRLISHLLGVHAKVVSAILREEKLGDEDLQLCHKSQMVWVSDILRHFKNEKVLSRERKQVAIFCSKLVYILIKLSNRWDDAFLETKTEERAAFLSSYFDCRKKVCGPAEIFNKDIGNKLLGILDSLEANPHTEIDNLISQLPNHIADALQTEDIIARYVSNQLADAIQVEESDIFQALSKSLQRPFSWSILGLTKPDYSKTVEEVYLEFTLCCIKEDKNLDVLSVVEDRSTTRFQNLPSWAPDYSVDLDYLQALRETADEVDYAASSPSTIPDFRWSIDDPHLLRLDGYQIDHISDITSMESTSQPLCIQAFTWKSFAKKLGSTYLNGELVKDVLWRTLVGGCLDANKCDKMREYFRAFMVAQEALKVHLQWSGTTDRTSEPANPRATQNTTQIQESHVTTGNIIKYPPLFSFATFCVLALRLARKIRAFIFGVPSIATPSEDTQSLSSPQEIDDLSDETMSLEEANEILERDSIDYDEFLQCVVKGKLFEEELRHSRRLFRTQNGYLGLGPMPAKIGDSVCILKGGRVPYVIRKVSEESSYFNFIGDCYVHGIMHGEAEKLGSFAWSEIELL